VHTSIDDFVMPRPEQIAAVTGRLRLLADPVRLTICCALAQGETNPSCLAQLAAVPVQGVSQHLAKLRLAGAVRPRRDGQRIWYELADPEVRDLVEHLLITTRGGESPTGSNSVAAGTEGRA
jgi:DNA-binding transcriptional ArsR family regulator